MLVTLVLLLNLLCSTIAEAPMEVMHSWNYVDFTFPSHQAREAMLRSEKFIPKHNIILDVDVWGDHTSGSNWTKIFNLWGVTGSAGQGQARKIFVTLPRMKPGIPATLATVSSHKYKGKTLLSPYPDWSWHRQGDCDGITSVFRTQVDQCGRLWILDSGTVDVFTDEPRRICRPQILVFNLHNDKLVGRYRFPDSVLDKDSLLITIAVDTRDSSCSSTFAYVADVVAFKVIVFDAAKEKSWRVASNLFYPYPLAGEFNINGVSFDLMDGVFGLALGPYKNGNRRLYFHSLASFHESWVDTSVIRNKSSATSSPRSFHVYDGVRDSQSGAQYMTENGIMFFGLLTRNAIACWNSKLPYGYSNIEIASQDDVNLQFASGLKVYNGYVWALTSRFQNYAKDNVSPVEDNYRIVVGKVSDMTRGTKCESVYEPYTASQSIDGDKPFIFNS